VKKYSQVLQRYYVQYLKGFDVAELQQVLLGMPPLSDELSGIVMSMKRSIDDLSLRQVEETQNFEFDGMRLDWVRLQVSVCCSHCCSHCCSYCCSTRSYNVV